MRQKRIRSGFAGGRDELHQARASKRFMANMYATVCYKKRCLVWRAFFVTYRCIKIMASGWQPLTKLPKLEEKKRLNAINTGKALCCNKLLNGRFQVATECNTKGRYMQLNPGIIYS